MNRKRHERFTAVRSRAARPTPLGGPWWAYVLVIGAANLARQLLLPDDVDLWVQVTTFVVTVVVVGAGVAIGARVWDREANSTR